MLRDKFRDFFNSQFQSLDDRIKSQSESLRKEVANQYKQIEAVTQIISLLDFEKPIPPLRGSVISPDAAIQVIDYIIVEKPKLIVELGSGVSTLLWAQTLKKYSIGSTIIAVDHLTQFADISRNLIAKHELAEYVTIIEAPLETTTINECEYEWYKASKISDILKEHECDIDLLFIDGPPRNVPNRNYRYPAIPILKEFMHDNTTVFLDDSGRLDEQHVMCMWQKDYDLVQDHLYSTEKGLAKFKNR